VDALIQGELKLKKEKGDEGVTETERVERAKKGTYKLKEVATEKVLCGYLVNNVRCLHCQKQRFTFDIYTDLMINIDKEEQRSKPEDKWKKEKSEALKKLEQRIMEESQKAEILENSEKIKNFEIDWSMFDNEPVPYFDKSTDILYRTTDYLVQDKELEGEIIEGKKEEKKDKEEMDEEEPIGQVRRGLDRRIPVAPPVGRGYSSYNPNRYYKMEKKVKRKFHINTLVNNFFKTTLLNNFDNFYRCENCEKKVDMAKTIRFSSTTFRLYDPAEHLVINLKRFRQSGYGMGGFRSFRKIDSVVEFEFELDMTPYCLCKRKVLIKQKMKETRDLCTSCTQ
jgi:hypothetical protein